MEVITLLPNHFLLSIFLILVWWFFLTNLIWKLSTGHASGSSVEARPTKVIPHERSSMTGFIFKIVVCLHIIFRSFGKLWVPRREEKQPILQREPVDIRVSLSKCEPCLEGPTAAQRIDESALNPYWQRLQHLEQLVTDLVNKPTRIPPDKEDTIVESLNRIKAIEHDLQKTKKVKDAVYLRSDFLSF